MEQTGGGQTGGAWLRLIVVEGSELDYEELLAELRRQQMAPHAVRIEDAEALITALDAHPWDAVIADHHLPHFSGAQALSIIRSRGLTLPFIIVSGAFGEDLAVAALQAGADDYLIKGRLGRLGTALRNARAAASIRNEREAARLALAESEQRLRELTDHLQQAVEAERAAIAREVHDDVGGMLTALRFDLDWIERHGNEAVALRARQGLETVNQAVTAVQHILHNLRPPALDAGLVAALEWLVEQFRRRTGIDARLSTNQDHIELPEALAITAYRVTQESLTNVAKHARARQVRLDLMVRRDTLSLEIADDGCGIRAEDLDKADSLGVRGLIERVRRVNGWLEVATGQAHGLVMLTLPLTPEAAARLEGEQDL